MGPTAGGDGVQADGFGKGKGFGGGIARAAAHAGRASEAGEVRKGDVSEDSLYHRDTGDSEAEAFDGATGAGLAEAPALPGVVAAAGAGPVRREDSRLPGRGGRGSCLAALPAPAEGGHFGAGRGFGFLPAEVGRGAGRREDSRLPGRGGRGGCSAAEPGPAQGSHIGEGCVSEVYSAEADLVGLDARAAVGDCMISAAEEVHEICSTSAVHGGGRAGAPLRILSACSGFSAAEVGHEISGAAAVHGGGEVDEAFDGSGRGGCLAAEPGPAQGSPFCVVRG